MDRKPAKEKVMLGLSGGVDSAVAAYLLQKQGFDVHAVYLKNWTEKDERGICPAERDRQDAIRVAAQLHIPFRTIDYEKEYRERVFAKFLYGLEHGLTPNPDMLCNPLVKFEALCATADEIGVRFIATGHYARNIDGRLVSGIDAQKDQSYFLAQITSEQLKRSLFPIGDYTKEQVRKIAHEIGLHVADKESTSGICFIGERDMKSFLNYRLTAAPGPVVTTSGKHLADHSGLPYYTIGQRHGFGGGGGVPYYVAEKRTDSNTLIVAPAYDSALLSEGLIAHEAHWFGFKPSFPLNCAAKIRYRQNLQSCTVTAAQASKLKVRFASPQRAVTPGQYVVFYDHDICLGSAVIEEPLSH